MEHRTHRLAAPRAPGHPGPAALVPARPAWRHARAALYLTAFTLAACGGGSGTGNAPTAAGTGQAPAPAAQPALTITGFTPAGGPAGTVVAVRGAGLDATTAATVGGLAATFRVVSGSELQLTVPAGAVSGRIGVSAGGRAAASSADFVVGAAPSPAPVPGAPAVTSVAPTAVIGGIGRLTLTGTALDQVATARLGTVALVIASQSATSLALDVPAAAASGTLSLVDRAGTARNVAQPITVVAALALTSFTPATIARGQTLTLNGRGLDRASEVRFGGGASAPIAGRTGSTALTVVVPATATSGAITAVAAAANGLPAEQVASATALTVLEPIVVTPQTHNVAAAGATVTVSGSGLTQVNAVTVGGAAAPITAQTATSLAFTVPAGVSCGAIALKASGLPDVSAGSVVVGAGCALRAAAVEFAQLMSQRAGDTYQRLSAGRETWVRAYLVSSVAGTPAPAGARALGFNAAGQALGSVSLTGPATLPVLAAGAAVSDAMRYDDAAAFAAELPAAWVQPGLRVRIEAGDAAAPSVSSEAAPAVAGSGGLRLVLVPLVSGGNVPVLPTAAEVLAHLQRKLPIPAGAITVRIRAPYTLTSANAGVVDSAQWSAALSELEQLRDAEAPNDHYYGMVRPLVNAGIAGIGYVNSIGGRAPALASLGWDASRASWPRTMVHELGHNFSRPHAPCGGVAGADPNYPYANGALGPTPLFDILANDVISPAGQADIMGYCNGNWFSDYNLNGVMRFLEARPAVLKDEVLVAADVAANGATQAATQAAADVAANAAAAVPASADVLVLSGTVEATGTVRLAPARVVRGDARRLPPAAAPAGSHLLRIVLADGRTLEQRFDATPLDHAPGEGHFLVRVPHPGSRIERVEVQREDKGARRMVASRAAKARAAAPAVAPSAAAAATAGPWAEAVRDGDALVLQWNADERPYASLALVVGGTRHVLALDATGGRWRIPREALMALPAGGEFEVSLSDGADTALLMVPRR